MLDLTAAAWRTALRAQQRSLAVPRDDLHWHAVAYFALPLIEGHTDQVHTICYNSRRQVDAWTERFRAAAHGRVDCEGGSADPGHLARLRHHHRLI
jgi:predicted O-linked N-acetylglucosamine transferase (SPINDLY family)